MNRPGPRAVSFFLAVAATAGLAPASAQRRDLDLSYGRWWHESGNAARTFAATLYRPLLGSIAYGVGITHMDDGRSPLDRTQTGADVSLMVKPGGRGVYGVGAFGLGVVHRGTQIDGQWSAGAGYSVSPVGFLELGVEARYRVEDQLLRGFWRLTPGDRRGWSLRGGLALRFGAAPRTRAQPPPPARGPPLATVGRLRPPNNGELEGLAATNGASDDGAALAADIVLTALDVMGTPYEWGGTDENGFDCSGLIQYAYQQHGIILPRVSRDQIRMGTMVPAALDRIRPGDLLGFAVEGRLISHVGLYVGDGMFIHSTSGGVTLSSLTRQDPNDQWWQRRWVAARRILN